MRATLSPSFGARSATICTKSKDIRGAQCVPAFSVLGIFVFSLLLEPVAVITGIFGLASKKMPVKIVGLVGMLVGIIMFAYAVAMMLKVADALR